MLSPNGIDSKMIWQAIVGCAWSRSPNDVNELAMLPELEPSRTNPLLLWHAACGAFRKRSCALKEFQHEQRKPYYHR